MDAKIIVSANKMFIIKSENKVICVREFLGERSGMLVWIACINKTSSDGSGLTEQKLTFHSCYISSLRAQGTLLLKVAQGPKLMET